MCSVVSDSLQHHGLHPARLLGPWGLPCKNTGVGCHFLLQGLFPAQGLNPCLLHGRQILYHSATRETLNLPEQLTKLRKPFYLLDYQFIAKEYNSGLVRWEVGPGLGKGVGRACLLAGSTLSKSPCVHQPGGSITWSFWSFVEASL